MNTMILIDTDTEFCRRLTNKLYEEDLIEKYKFFPVTPNTTLESAAMTESCIQEVNQTIFDEPNVIGIFVDVVIVEGPRKGDTTGIAIATELRKHFPNLPIFCITGKYSDDESDTDVMSGATLEDLDGVFSKSYLEGKYFSAKRLRLIFEKAHVKRSRIRPLTAATSTLPETLKNSYNINSLDARVEAQIQQLGSLEFWSMVNKLLPGSQGVISYMRPGRSGAYVFRVRAKFVSQDGATTHPKSWALKVSTNVGELERELRNYSELTKTPLPRSFYPKTFGTEVVKVGNLAAFAVELEEDTRSLMEQFPLLTEPSLHKVIDGIARFMQDTYGESRPRIVKPWREYYRLEKTALTNIASILIEERSLFKEFDEKNYDRVVRFINDGGSAEPFAEVDANVDLRTIHGDFNARNLLLDKDHSLIIIDFASRCQSHVVRDIAKLERDVIFRIFDFGSSRFSDWSRLEEWKKFLHLNQRDRIFSSETPDHGSSDPNLQKSVLFISKLRSALKSMSPQLSEREYVMGLLYYSLLALGHPEISIQKKVFAVPLITSLIDLLN